MNTKLIRLALSAWIVWLVLALPALGHAGAAAPTSETFVLYDAASGTTPDPSRMSFTDFPPGTASPVYSEGLTVLDSTAAGSDSFAGWVASAATTSGFPLLDRTTGFHVNFTVQIDSESHSNSNRAGFNVIVLGQDAKGIEIAFWTNQIWVQSDDQTGGLFRHGEGVAVATTAAINEYQVNIAGATYTLIANGEPILTGPVRDYSAFDGFPDPYETPNFLFLGDNTTSAQARVRLGFVSVTGTGIQTPTTIPTMTSTSSPLPDPSSTPLPSATPVPSPTAQPSGRALCPSGWILLALFLPVAWMRKTIRAG
jgi:hypothetical protein